MFNFSLKAGVLALSALATSAMAQDTATTPSDPVVANGARFGAWVVNCEALAVNQTACVLSQRLVRSADNVFLAELLAFNSGDGERSYLAARVPNGVFFPSGFAFKAGEGDQAEDSPQRQEFVWQSCSRDICEALLEIDMASIVELEKAESLIAGYRPNLRADPVVFRFSIDGASAGLEALKAATKAAN